MRDDGCSPYILIIHIHLFSNKYLVFFCKPRIAYTDTPSKPACSTGHCAIAVVANCYGLPSNHVECIMRHSLWSCALGSFFVIFNAGNGPFLSNDVINRSSVQTSLETRLKGDSHILIVHNHMHQSHEIQPIYVFAWRAPFEHAKQTSRCK